MSYFSDYFPLLDESKIKTKVKLYPVYQAIKKTENEGALRKLIDAAVRSGSDIFRTPSDRSISIYRSAGRILRTKPTTKAAKELKSADSRLVRLVNKVARVQRKKVKGYPLTGMSNSPYFCG
jgi:hypothetical protein